MSGCVTYRAGTPVGKVDIIAHRGASALAPENTLAAFRLAHELQADWFELDCTLTKDGHVIVIHDDTVDRTTGVKGRVLDMTLAELKQLEAGAWKDAKFAGEPLPTLNEALDFAKGEIGVYIEIKDSDNDAELSAQILEAAAGQLTADEALSRKMMDLIEASGTRNLELTRKAIQAVRDRGMARQIVIQSFSPIVCAVALIEAPELRTELLGYWKEEEPGIWENYLRWLYLIDAPGFNVNNGSLTEGRLALLKRSDRSVAIWTVNQPADMERLAAWGVDAIITDRPDTCRRTLEKMGKR
jgi:glycerophosphoryl diester phosphodiesterase